MLGAPGCCLGWPCITAAGDPVALCVGAQMEPAAWGIVACDWGFVDRRVVIKKSAAVQLGRHAAARLWLLENHLCNHGNWRLRRQCRPLQHKGQCQ